ncbi:hypothetical protein CALCODRAFT_181342 [Calocera cornea HHB12733]|uniref:Uncharacterized protein n=1 Tax=Calocera cornea HHB12733 TaxID=1353952 RepID=A0A165HRH6_9BASI|nr:hypothetical protein CALCODRAFT_181342 [Calocera cornea HHB12733]
MGRAVGRATRTLGRKKPWMTSWLVLVLVRGPEGLRTRTVRTGEARARLATSGLLLNASSGAQGRPVFSRGEARRGGKKQKGEREGRRAWPVARPRFTLVLLGRRDFYTGCQARRVSAVRQVAQQQQVHPMIHGTVAVRVCACVSLQTLAGVPVCPKAGVYAEHCCSLSRPLVADSRWPHRPRRGRVEGSTFPGGRVARRGRAYGAHPVHQMAR